MEGSDKPRSQAGIAIDEEPKHEVSGVDVTFDEEAMLASVSRASSHAGLALDEEAMLASVSRAISTGAGLALGDEPLHTGSGPASVAGIALDDFASGPAATPSGEPLKLVDESSILLAARGITSLDVVLGIRSTELEQLDDPRVRARAKLFRERWVELEKRRALLQELTKHEAVSSWLFVVDVIAGRADATRPPNGLVGPWAPLFQELPRLGPREILVRTVAHQKSQLMAELVAHTRTFVVLDRILQWNERLELEQHAGRFGFGAAEIAEALTRVERELGTKIARESEVEWKARQPKGEWEPHETLGGDDESWDLEQLRAALVDPKRFAEAIAVASGSNVATSLTTYLKHQRGGKNLVPIAIEAQGRAIGVECPALAVWWFWWKTVPPGQAPVLHLIRGHRPVVDPQRRAGSIAELLELVRTTWTIDRLAGALDDGLLESWLECQGNEPAARVARERRGELKRSPGSTRKAALRRAVIEVMWWIGLRGLPLRTDDGGSVIVHSIEEMFSAATDCNSFLDEALASGLLESWLSTSNPALASATMSIRQDARTLKLSRWLQRAGFPHYEVGGQRVDSVQDFAELPKRGVPFERIAEHIRQGVPQARFASRPDVVAALDAVSDDTGLLDMAKGVIACLRIGLRELPIAIDGRVEWIAKPSQLAEVLRNGSRDILYVLLSTRVLETWMEAIEPGSLGHVAQARALPKEIAVDRALRPWLRQVFPATGIGAASFEALRALAVADVERLCGDSNARLRIRDALAIDPIPNAPMETTAFPLEQTLTTMPSRRAAMVFAWHVLRTTILHVGTVKVQTLDELFAAIADPHTRVAARNLAADGLLTSWVTDALRMTITSDLQGKVESSRFPSLCLELGEPPPPVSMSVTGNAVDIPEGRDAAFEVLLVNDDLVRDASVVLETAMSRPIGAFVERGQATVASQLVSTIVPVSAGTKVQRSLVFTSKIGTSGSTKLQVVARLDGSRVAVGSREIVANVRFPWRDLALSVLGWLAAGVLGFALAASFLAGRATNLPLTGEIALNDSGIWGFGVVISLIFAGPPLFVWLRRRRNSALAGPNPPPFVPRSDNTIWILLGVLVGGSILIYAIGYVALWAAAGIDQIGLRLHGDAVVADPGLRQLASGWLAVGAALGTAWGLAVGLRGLERRWLGEIARAVVILGLLAALVEMGAQ